MQTVLSNRFSWPILVTLAIIRAVPAGRGLYRAGGATRCWRTSRCDRALRVGPHGRLKTIADALKLMLKEDIIRRMPIVDFCLPVMSTFTGRYAFAVCRVLELFVAAA